MNQIINMVIRQVMRRLITKGVDVGFNQASKIGKRRQNVPQGGIDDYGNAVDVSPEENARRDRAGRDQGKQARDALKNLRRLNRF